jgi:hypothetical protein
MRLALPFDAPWSRFVSPVLRRHNRLPTVLSAAALAVAGLLSATPATADAPNHAVVVSAVPATSTPDVEDGRIEAIQEFGSKVLVGGSFTRVQNRGSNTDIPRRFLFAFDKATGAVDPAFAPTVSSRVRAIIAGPTPGTAFIAGDFTTVNGVQRRRVAVLNVADGSLTAWNGPAFNGRVNDAVVVGPNLLLGGTFTVVGGQARNGLASLNVADGQLNNYLTTALTEHHNYDGSGASAPVGPAKLAAKPDGTQLVVIGNFQRADGVIHDQVVKLDLGPSAATIAPWNTTGYTPRCAAGAFDAWIRDVAYSPDGSYFVIVTTGAPFPPTLCDTAARWESNATGTNVQPTWVDWTGGDTLLSVAISETAVYVGGHQRWMNNSFGRDSAAQGAVARPGIAALDPVNGIPLKWNPGRNPRGYGVTEMELTPTGLYIGSDTQWIGNRQYNRKRIAFFPIAGGGATHPTNTATLPGRVYQAGSVPGAGANDIFSRTYSGSGAPGPRAPVANPDGTTCSAARGAFWVGGTLFYGQNGALQRRSFDGASFGPAALVDPYHDPLWDTVETGSGPEGQTYRGSTVNFYGEITNVTGMFYAAGRLYYTLNGQNGLFYRWFTPDSGIVGPDRFTVSGASGFATSGGVFVSGANLYMVDRNTGALLRRDWTGTAPAGAFTVVSGPGLDGQDWRGRAVFLAP